MLEDAYREKAYYNDDVSLSSGNLPLEEDDTDGRISLNSPRRSHRIEVMDHAIGMHNPSALYALLESLGPQPHTLLTCGLRPGVGAPSVWALVCNLGAACGLPDPKNNLLLALGILHGLGHKARR